MSATIDDRLRSGETPDRAPNPPQGPRVAHATFDVRRAVVALDAIAAGWAISILATFLDWRGSLPGFVPGALLVTVGLAGVGRGAAPVVARVARVSAGVAAVGVLGAVVGLVAAAGHSTAGVRTGAVLVLVGVVGGALGASATFSSLSADLGARRFCLRWRRAGAVVLGALAFTTVIALVAFVTGRAGHGVGFWHAPFGRELPTPVPQVLEALVGLAVAAAALALALALETTRSWLRRLGGR